MANDWIRIRGARTHNLKNVNVDIPRNKLTVITGLSGSGKSSLAFDTLYAEGQRRYAESVSSYARRFMDVLDKPDVDSIEGLSPSISIEQHTGTLGSRSTVATVTEAADYLRLLFARAGSPYCPEHHVPLSRSKLRLPVYLKLRAVTESASSVNTAELSVSSLPVLSSGFSFDAAKDAAHTTMSTPRSISSFFVLFICASF